MAYPPKLLCKHRLVYNAEFFKTNTSFPSIQADFIPMKHMHLSNPLVMTSFLTNGFRNSETRESIKWQSLKYSGLKIKKQWMKFEEVKACNINRIKKNNNNKSGQKLK